MNKLINLIGGVVLCGILIKLSYVFVYLFDQLDNGGVVARVTGVTFAFASIYFVVKVRQRWLKATVVLLDVSTILYYYLHDELHINIAYASIIVAAYSGIIVYYLGRIVSESATTVSESATKRERMLEERLRIGNELQTVQSEIVKTRRRIKDSRTPATTQGHEAKLAELLVKEKALKLKLR